MIARVSYNGKVYHSYVFGYFQLDYMPHYVVYNSMEEKFEIVAYFSKKCDGHRQIGLLNENEKEFVKINDFNLQKGIANKCKGYPWFFENLDIIKSIELGNKIDDKYISIAKELNSTIDPDKWNEVTNQEEADDFMYHVGGFHDMYLIGMSATADYLDCTNASKLQLLFHSQGAFNVLVEFEDHVFLKYGFCTCNRIYLSSLIVEGEHKYWVDGEEDLSYSDIRQYDYIQGKYLRWKFILKEDEEW